MSTLQFLVRPAGRLPLDAFADTITGQLGPRLLALQPRRLTLAYTADPPPRLSLIPFRRAPIALCTVGAESDDPAPWLQAIREVLPEAQASGYLVDEVMPVSYQRSWPDGGDTPGIGLLTLMRKRPKLDWDGFIERWHGGHTPLSLKIHPLWSYQRCVVKKPLTPDSPPWDGIVEEHFRTAQDLLNPVRFFGGPLKMGLNMVRVGLDIKGFIDMSTIENYLVRERHLRTA